MNKIYLIIVMSLGFHQSYGGWGWADSVSNSISNFGIKVADEIGIKKPMEDKIKSFMEESLKPKNLLQSVQILQMAIEAADRIKKVADTFTSCPNGVVVCNSGKLYRFPQYAPSSNLEIDGLKLPFNPHTMDVDLTCAPQPGVLDSVGMKCDYKTNEKEEIELDKDGKRKPADVSGVLRSLIGKRAIADQITKGVFNSDWATHPMVMTKIDNASNAASSYVTVATGGLVDARSKN